MKKFSVAMLLSIPSLAYSQSAEIPSLDVSSRILKIPYLKYQNGDTTLYIRAELQGSGDFSQFTLRNAVTVSAPGAVDLQNVAGQYTGVLAAYVPSTKTKIGPFVACPEVPFNPGNADLDVSVTGSQLRIDLDVFPELVCRLEGSLIAGMVSGTFQCSDFNSGSWTSTIIKPSAVTNSLSMNASLVGKDCSFDASFSGIKK